jgi:hypothetical protein
MSCHHPIEIEIEIAILVGPAEGKSQMSTLFKPSYKKTNFMQGGGHTMTTPHAPRDLIRMLPKKKRILK